MAYEVNDPLKGMAKHILDTIPESVQQKIEENKALQASIFKLASIYSFLEKDVRELHEFGRQNETDQAWRRSAYRAAFSWIEGVIYQMKQVVLCTQGGYYNAQFTRGEMAFLLEESYYLEKNGKVNVRINNFVEIDKNLRFAFSKFADGFKISTRLEVGGQGWQHFKKAVEIRNRLTYPKDVSDLSVSDEDMRSLINTINWFSEQYKVLIADVMATTEPIQEKIKAEGKDNIQKIVEDAQVVVARAGKVGDVIVVIDELMSEDIEPEKINEKFEIVKSNLEDLRKEIFSNLSRKKD